MALTATPDTASPPRLPHAGPGGRAGNPTRRRRLMRGALAVVLIAGCAAAAVLVGSWVGGRVAVLAAARDLPAGHVVSEADLRVLSVAADPQAGLIPAADKTRVTGSTTAFPVASGTLLVDTLLGRTRWPVPGKAVAALALKPGRYPPGLSAGTAVSVIIAPPPEAATTSDDPDVEPRRAAATVISVVAPPDGGGGATVVSLLMDEADAEMVAAAAADRVALVQTGGG